MREWCDKQVISHLAFIPAIPITIFYRQPPFPEPLFFIIPLLILSTLYHRHHEPIATPLSRTELAAAFGLYFTGVRNYSIRLHGLAWFWAASAFS